MSRKHIAYELIRDVFLLGSWQLAGFEYVPEIPVPLDKVRALDLKVCFREFRLKKHIPELHIDFGPFGCFAQ